MLPTYGPLHSLHNVTLHDHLQYIFHPVLYPLNHTVTVESTRHEILP